MKPTANIKIVLLIFISFFNQSGFTQHHGHGHSGSSSDSASVHGMLMFGSEKIYLSHLPMFHNPHDYQVLFEVEISNQSRDIYLQSIQNDPQEKVYTIVPESFVLPEIAKGAKSFMAQIFKGHFERGGAPLTQMLKFNIKKVLYFKKFDANAAKPQLSSNILIGNEKEQFLIHTVTSKPDFDHISKIKVKSNSFKNQLLKKDHLMIQVDSPNNEPLGVGVNFEAVLMKNQAQTKIEFTILESLYLEFGDLSF